MQHYCFMALAVLCYFHSAVNLYQTDEQLLITFWAWKNIIGILENVFFAYAFWLFYWDSIYVVRLWKRLKT